MVGCLSSTTILSIIIFVTCSVSKVNGWGVEGHAYVAGVAQTLLSSEALPFVLKHLPANATGNMSKVASWADNILYPDSDPNYRQWTWSKPLHYVDTKDWACRYDRQSDCDWSASKRCVDGAIQNYTNRLADTGLDDIQRTQALLFIIHFIGDAHQPLHAGFQGDLGGNEITGEFCGKSIKLHALWDTGMIQKRIKDDFSGQSGDFFQYLLKELRTTYAQNVSDWSECKTPDESTFSACSTAWVEESAEINCVNSYIDENGDRLTPKTKFNMCDKYQKKNIPMVEQRILQGGVRLATVLNKIAHSARNNVESNVLATLLQKSARRAV